MKRKQFHLMNWSFSGGFLGRPESLARVPQMTWSSPKAGERGDPQGNAATSPTTLRSLREA